jgi:hypothetical protein
MVGEGPTRKGSLMKGLTLNVYRAHGQDCTNGGITAKADRLVVVGILIDGEVQPLPRDCQVFEADELLMKCPSKYEEKE